MAAQASSVSESAHVSKLVAVAKRSSEDLALTNDIRLGTEAKKAQKRSRYEEYSQISLSPAAAAPHRAAEINADFILDCATNLLIKRTTVMKVFCKAEPPIKTPTATY